MKRKTFSVVVLVALLFMGSESVTRGAEDALANNVRSIAWSPDGSSIAMSFFADESIAIIDVDSGRIRELESFPTNPRNLEWSPDGLYLAATSNDYPGEFSVIDVGHNQRVLWSGDLMMRSVYYTSLSWSPDSRFLAVAFQFGTGSSADAELGIWDVAGGELFKTNSEISAYSVDWNPDSSMIVATQHPYFEEMYLVDADTAAIVKTINIGQVFEAKWSADGTLLALYRVPDPFVPYLMTEMQIFDTQSDVVHTLYSEDDVEGRIGGFDWDPTQNRIALSVFQPKTSLWELIVWDWTGEETKVLLENPDGLGVIAWKPDGKEIAYIDANHDLYVIPVD